MPVIKKPVVVPKTGLALVKAGPAVVETPKHKPAQVIKVTFTDDTVKELIKSTRNGGQGVKLTFGKTPVRRCSLLLCGVMFLLLTRIDQTLYYGNKSKRLTSQREPATQELYRASTDGKDKLALAGVVSHKLEVMKAEKTVVGTDAALLALQNTLAAHNKQKESKK